jgi:general stress protein 26
MEEKEARQLGLELMETADMAYLSTVDGEGFPQTRIMGNLRNAEQYPGLKSVFSGHGEDFLVYLTTSASSAKMEQINWRRNSRSYKPGAQETALAGGLGGVLAGWCG